MQKLILGVPAARWFVAGAGLAFFGVALSGASDGSGFGHCLAAVATVGHCAWCYAAVAALLTAAAPWPAPLEARAR